MHVPTIRAITSDSPGETCAIARRLAPVLRTGDTVLLTGDIGAGKTHFARCAIQSLLACPEDVPSPTYTLVQTYAGRSGEIWHVDLYRLVDTSEVFELGLMDAFCDAICLVEWPDRLGDLAPPGALHLTVTADDAPDARRLTFGSRNPEWAPRMEGIWNG
jgi:tRNA threonylcarbamoyladenosine biosynthesis protein TsaE